MAWPVRGIVAICVGLLSVTYALPALAAGSVCQWSTMGDGSRVQMCKDANGKWRPVEAEDEVAPANYASGFPQHAEVIYTGNWSADVSTAKKINFSSLNLGSILNQAANSRQTKTIAGDMRMTLTISGSSFTAVAYGRNFEKEQFSGTVSNGICRMSGVTTSLEGRCGKEGFSGTIGGKNKQGQSVRGSFQTSALQVVDIDERAKQQLVAEQARQAAIAAAEAKIRNAPAAGPVLTKKLAGFVSTDSQGWAFNRFDSGSVTNVKIIDGSVKSGHYTLRGEYTYNGGARGWVLAQMSGPNLECIQFHDAIIGCRALRTPEQGQAMRNALVSGFSGGQGSSGQSNSQESQDRMEGMSRAQDEQNQRAAAERAQQESANAAFQESLRQPNSLGW